MTDSDASGKNPYQAPAANGSLNLPPEPNVMLWVVAGAVAGGLGFGVVEIRGLTPSLTTLPNGIGGAIAGLLIGAVCGRVVGRLLVARHRFRQMDRRRQDLSEEYGSRDKPRDNESPEA